MLGVRFVRALSISTVLLTPAIGFRTHDALADPVAKAVREAQATVRDFFSRLYESKKAAIERKYSGTYQKLLDNGMEDTKENKQKVMIALFLHDLIKSDGVLGNAYVLTEHGGRRPNTMIADMFSSSPRHTIGGERTYVYGRCDEIEMLYAAILKQVFNIPARIVLVFSNHVNTEIRLSNGYLSFDNSFNFVEFSRTPGKDKPPADGKYSIKRANRLARLDLTIVLDPQGVERAGRAVERHLQN